MLMSTHVTAQTTYRIDSVSWSYRNGVITGTVRGTCPGFIAKINEQQIQTGGFRGSRRVTFNVRPNPNQSSYYTIIIGCAPDTRASDVGEFRHYIVGFQGTRYVGTMRQR
jgi:hypothetical protein